MSRTVYAYDYGTNPTQFRVIANSFNSRKQPDPSGPGKLAIIDDRALDRECLAQSLIAHGLDMNIELFSTVETWRQSDGAGHAGLLITVGRNDLCEDAFAKQVKNLIDDYPDLPVVVLGENRDLRQILRAFEIGVRGYISSATGLDVCVGAITLALAGGTFISAENLSDLRQLLVVAEDKERRKAAMFTQREVEVIDALTQGMPNKIIAYELNLRESTVKVHVRNIMKKLNARNRTEVIYKISDMFKE